MEKEQIKRAICEFIDSVDEIRDFSITSELTDEIKDLSGKVYGTTKPTGIANLYLTTYKK